MDTDTFLCSHLAKLARVDQPVFVDLYTKDRDDAVHWISLPAWKRPIREGSREDRSIWKFFVMLRIKEDAEHIVTRDIGDFGGALSILHSRLGLVLSLYGHARASGREGDRLKEPWAKEVK